MTLDDRVAEARKLLGLPEDPPPEKVAPDIWETELGSATQTPVAIKDAQPKDPIRVRKVKGIFLAKTTNDKGVLQSFAWLGVANKETAIFVEDVRPKGDR